MNKHWLNEPQFRDFLAAKDYLEFLFSPEETKKFVDNLKQAVTIKKKAVDILRASGLPMLSKDDNDIKDDLKKLKKGKKLAPVLLVRHNYTLIIADGYHRMCAACYVSDDIEIPCRLV